MYRLPFLSYPCPLRASQSVSGPIRHYPVRCRHLTRYAGSLWDMSHDRPQKGPTADRSGQSVCNKEDLVRCETGRLHLARHRRNQVLRGVAEHLDQSH